MKSATKSEDCQLSPLHISLKYGGTHLKKGALVYVQLKESDQNGKEFWNQSLRFGKCGFGSFKYSCFNCGFPSLVGSLVK